MAALGRPIPACSVPADLQYVLLDVDLAGPGSSQTAVVGSPMKVGGIPVGTHTVPRSRKVAQRTPGKEVERHEERIRYPLCSSLPVY